MNLQAEKEVLCPYCGEPIVLLIDHSIPEQAYIEDCEVCCRPIVIHVNVLDEDNILVEVSQEDD